MNYKRLTQKEWDKSQRTALKRFVKEVLGTRPTRKSVSSGMYNNDPISLLEWLGVILLLAIAVVTGYKMVAVAMPFAASFYPPETHSAITSSFGIATAIVFVLFSTSGLIYYKLMDEYDDEIAKQKDKYATLQFEGGIRGALLFAGIVAMLLYWALDFNYEIVGVGGLLSFLIAWYLGGLPTNTLQYVSPRLYQWLTYLTAIWLLHVSSRGDGSFFERYLIVLAEVALAYLVANLLAKRAKWRTAVTAAHTEATAKYDSRLDAYQLDAQYLQILYRELREVLTYLERRDGGRKAKPNLFMEIADGNVVDTIIVKEYKRNTGGQRFAGLISTEKSIPSAVVKTDEKRVPPRGDKLWTVSSLTQDFIVRGLKPTDQYNEKSLQAQYAPDYNCRSAWRNGAKEYFK